MSSPTWKIVIAPPEYIRMTHRKLNFIDRLLREADRALRTVSGETRSCTRPSPAKSRQDQPLAERQAAHAAGLMRINHSGEVCAQGLYRGQALTARKTSTRQAMEQAAAEEEDHLVWCAQRLEELDSRPSQLNPLWYAASFGLGAGAGLISDRLSLGFVAATEQQVCRHLESHLDKLPLEDTKSRAVIAAMLVDEGRHATQALKAGGLAFPEPVKKAMSLIARVMTASSYRI